MKCDRCGQPGIRLVGESNEIIACIDHARAYDRPHGADGEPMSGNVRAIAAVLDRLSGFVAGRAIGARARGDGAEERRWLDATILIGDLVVILNEGCEAPAVTPLGDDVHSLSEALYDAGLEEILGVPDEALDEVARVVLSSPWLAERVEAAKAEAWDEGWLTGNRWAFSEADADDIRANPYRAAALDPEATP